MAKTKTKKKISRRIQIRRRGILYYVRIGADGKWQSWIRAKKSIALDRKSKEKTKAKPGQRDRGD